MSILTKKFEKVKTQQELSQLIKTLQDELNDNQIKTNKVMSIMNKEVKKLNITDKKDKAIIMKITRNKKKYEKNIKNIVNIMSDLFSDKRKEL